MNHVTDIREAGEDTSVLTDAGSGGLLGRGVLSEGALAEHLGEAETPRYVLRNKKHGVVVEGPDGTEEYEPDRRHSGVAVVSDVRVLFAAGRSGEDVTQSVSLADVVDVRTEDGLIGGAFVVETVTDERYRFPCRGNLEPVQEYLDAAVGVWTRAQRHVEEASDQVERLRSAFESGNADVVLAATGDVEAKLADAREAADALDGARAEVDDRAASVRGDLAALERRAYAEYAEQARERAHVRWDDQEYEAAMDNVDEADEAYAAALDIDADEPDDDLLAGRRETLAEERERLADAPVDRAEHAVDVADAAGGPGPAIDWWETAVERFETALSLDWGRDNRRFAGDREQLRDDLADAARELVAAHCEYAREHIADGDEVRETDPDRAADAYDRAAEALAAAREVSRERVPEAADDVDAVAATLEDRLEALPGYEAPVGTKVDGGRTGTATRSTTGDGDESDGTDTGGSEETGADGSNGTSADGSDADSEEPTDSESGDTPSDAGSGDSGVEPTDSSATETVDDRTADDETPDGVTGRDGQRETDADGATAGAGEVHSGASDTAETGPDEAAESGGSEVDEGLDVEPEDDPLEETETVIGEPDGERGEAGTGGWRTGDELVDNRDQSPDGTGEGDDSAGSDGESDDDRDAAESRVTDPTAVDADALPSLVARVFESAGWSTTVFGVGTGNRYDLLAETDEPVGVTVCIWTIHPDTVEMVDAATVERYANYFEGVDEADAAAVCSAAPVSETARARAADTGFELLEHDDLVDHLESLALDTEAF